MVINNEFFELLFVRFLQPFINDDFISNDNSDRNNHPHSLVS